MHLGTALLLLAAAAAATATRPLQTRRLLELPPFLPWDQVDVLCATAERDTCVSKRQYCKGQELKEPGACSMGWACSGSEQGIGCVQWDTPCPYSGALAEDGTVRGWIWCVDKVRYCKDYKQYSCDSGTRCVDVDYGFKVECVPDTSNPPAQPPTNPDAPPSNPGGPPANPCTDSTQGRCITQMSYCLGQFLVQCVAGTHCDGNVQPIACVPDAPNLPEQPASNSCESSTQDHCISEMAYCKGKRVYGCGAGQYCNWSQQGIGCSPSGGGTNPGTGTNPPPNPNPGTGTGTNPPTNPNPGTGTKPAHPCASSTKDQCLQVGIIQFLCLGTQAWMCPPGSTCTTGSDGKPYCNSVWGSGRVDAVAISDLNAASSLTTLPGGSASGIAGSSGASAIAGATASALSGGG